MGFAASRFGTLTKLCSGITREFSGVVLTALVLNDTSIRAQSFVRHMADQMENLNTHTGEKFLFFSLIDPPKEWGGLPNPKFPDLAMPSSSEAGDRTMMCSFLERINYANADLPGVLLTVGNLQSKSYIYIPTSEDQIDDLLIGLGNFCSSSSGYISLNNKELKLFLDMMVKENGWELCHSNTTIAQSLRVVSAVPELESDSFLNREIAIDCIRRELNAPNARKSTKTNALIASILSRCLEYEYRRRDEYFIRQFESFDIDRETRGYWNTYYDILLPMQDVIRSLTSEYRIPYNLSTMNLNLLVGVENELNLSIVQLMREECGIQMPKFYCLYDPNCRFAYVDCNGANHHHRVYLNERSYRNQRGDLKVVSIGDVRAAYMNMDMNCIFKGGRFCDLLDFFSKVRRGHSGYEDVTVMEEIEQCSKRFEQEFVPDVLPQLIELKKRLKGLNG